MTACIIAMPARQGDTPSAIYRTIWQAVRERRRIVFGYAGHAREACPLILGYSADGKEVAFAYQVGGKTSKGTTLPVWRCFYLAKVSGLATQPGEWREGDSPRQAQSCVRHVDVDANIPDTFSITSRPQTVSLNQDYAAQPYSRAP